MTIFLSIERGENQRKIIIFIFVTLFFLSLLQMPHTTGGDSLNMETEESNALEEIISIIKPYLKIKSADMETTLKEKLNDLGVSNLSHFSVLEEKDLTGLISVADFRLMRRKFNESHISGNVLLANPFA